MRWPRSRISVTHLSPGAHSVVLHTTVCCSNIRPTSLPFVSTTTGAAPIDSSRHCITFSSHPFGGTRGGSARTALSAFTWTGWAAVRMVQTLSSSDAGLPAQTLQRHSAWRGSASFLVYHDADAPSQTTTGSHSDPQLASDHPGQLRRQDLFADYGLTLGRCSSSATPP